MAEENNSHYPDSVMDHYRMNRVMRHRLRNLCAGVKMTVERIANMTAATNPQIGTRCDIVVGELDNLRLFTDRMDWLFDALPQPEPKSLFELVSSLRMSFSPQFPFCNLDLGGTEATLVLHHGSWVFFALHELMVNAGEAAGENGKVTLKWSLDNAIEFTIANDGEAFPDDIPLQPPVPFYTNRSRHDGLGLGIANRIFLAIGAKWDILRENNLTTVKITIPETEIKHE